MQIGNICFGMLQQEIIFPIILCVKLSIITLIQMFCNFKPLHVQTNPWVWKQIINARLLCLQSQCFSKPFDSLLHALILNLFGGFSSLLHGGVLFFARTAALMSMLKNIIIF